MKYTEFDKNNHTFQAGQYFTERLFTPLYAVVAVFDDDTIEYLDFSMAGGGRIIGTETWEPNYDAVKKTTKEELIEIIPSYADWRIREGFKLEYIEHVHHKYRQLLQQPLKA